MLLCYFNRISCQMWKICRMLVRSTDSAACKDCILRIDFACSIFILCFDSHTFPIFNDYIRHLCIFIYFYILKLLYLHKQLASDLFSCHIFMKQDSRSGMCTFSCICKFSVLLFKFYTVFHKIINNISGIADHNIHRFFPVLIMSCLHRVFKITVIVFFIS